MTRYKNYSTEQYEAFLKNPFNANFNISEESIAKWFVNQAGARPVMNSYGVNYDNLISTYIPQLKAGLNGGYVLFLAITVQEGGGAGNWINHYGKDTAGDGVGTMRDDINYINTILNANYPIARNAPEVGATYVPDNAGEDQRLYDSLPNGSIGKYYMPATMAGNSWVFATNWSEAHQPSPVYYGNPYDQIIKVLIDTGADPFTGQGGSGNPDPKPQRPTTPVPAPPTTPSPEPSKNLLDRLFQLLKEIFTHRT